MRTMRPHVQAVLDALLAAESHMTTAQIQAATGLDADLVAGAIRDLCAWGIVVSVGARSRHAGRGRYVHHSKLRAAAPARQDRQEVWRGVDWRASAMRPGCLDHERIPSLRGSERVPYQPPMHFVTGIKP